MSAATRDCTACHQEISSTVVICPHCRAFQTTGRAEPQRQAAAEPARAPSRQSWTCGCGQLNTDDPFCHSCGELVDASRAEPEPDPTQQVSVGPGPRRPPAPEPSLGAVLSSSPIVRLRLQLPGGGSLTVTSGRPVLLGRESGEPQVAEAFAAFPGVSRRHATLLLQDGRLSVTDHESVNGTSVNDQPVGSATLPAGDVRTITLGHHAVIHVHPAGDDSR